MTEIGARVGAMLSADKDEVLFLGWGTYEGDVEREAEILGVRILSDGKPLMVTNPKITLDNGDVVWGCECWWGPEDRVRAFLDGRTVVDVRIGDYRDNE